MTSFANEHFELYLPDQELDSNILKENPVPDKVDQVKKLDDSDISILNNRRGSPRNELINQDKVLEKIQVKITDIMRPLCRLWDIVEKVNNTIEQSLNESLEAM